MKKLTFTLALAVLLAGCYSDLSEIEIGKVELSPEIAMPLLDSRFTVKDLLEAADSSFLYSTAEDGTLVLSLSDSLYSESAARIYALDDQQVNLPPIFLTPEEISTFNTTGQIVVQRQVAVDFPTQSALELLALESGFVELTLNEDFPANGLVGIDIFNYQGSAAVPNIIDFNYDWTHIDGGNRSSGTLQSNAFGPVDFVFDGEPGQGEVNLNVEFALEKVADNNLVFGANSLEIALNFSQLIFEQMRGDLPPEPLNAGPVSVNTQFFDGGQLLSDLDVFFERPSFTILYTSTFGIPARFQFADFTTFRDGNEEVVSPQGSTELGAGTEESPSESSASLDDAFKSILNELPDSVEVSVQGTIDPDDLTNNYITQDSRIEVGFDVEIPLELSLAGLSIEEQITIDEIDAGDLIRADLKLLTENGLPIDLNLEVVFLDSDSTELYTLVNEAILQGGTSDTPTTDLTIFKLEDDPSTSENELDFLDRVASAGIRSTVNTTNGGTEVVVISSDSELQINLALQGQYRITTEN